MSLFRLQRLKFTEKAGNFSLFKEKEKSMGKKISKGIMLFGASFYAWACLNGMTLAVLKGETGSAMFLAGATIGFILVASYITTK